MSHFDKTDRRVQVGDENRVNGSKVVIDLFSDRVQYYNNSMRRVEHCHMKSWFTTHRGGQQIEEIAPKTLDAFGSRIEVGDIIRGIRSDHIPRATKVISIAGRRVVTADGRRFNPENVEVVRMPHESGKESQMRRTKARTYGTRIVPTPPPPPPPTTRPCLADGLCDEETQFEILFPDGRIALGRFI